MLRLDFTTEQIEALKYQKFHHPHPRVRRKMEALLLKSKGLPHSVIAELVGVSANALLRYFRQFQAGGVTALAELNFYQPNSALEPFKSAIIAHFQAHPFVSVNQAKAEIETLTGISRSPTQIREFLVQLGIKRRKVGQIPAKADLEKQAEFLDNKLQPRLDEAEKGTRQVFFLDAVHFVLAPFLGYLWSFARIFIQAPSGRQRFNVLGALDAVTKNIMTVTNTTYITSREVCEMLAKLAEQAVEGIPITVVLDNARYQRCKLVQFYAEQLGIELLFLPPYSPNFNLIERLWKFVKKKCLYSKYYDNFEKFQGAITECLETAPTTNKDELKSLLTLKFQTFDKSSFITV
jgi:transposase